MHYGQHNARQPASEGMLGLTFGIVERDAPRHGHLITVLGAAGVYPYTFQFCFAFRFGGRHLQAALPHAAEALALADDDRVSLQLEGVAGRLPQRVSLATARAEQLADGSNIRYREMVIRRTEQEDTDTFTADRCITERLLNARGIPQTDRQVSLWPDQRIITTEECTAIQGICYAMPGLIHAMRADNSLAQYDASLQIRKPFAHGEG